MKLFSQGDILSNQHLNVSPIPTSVVDRFSPPASASRSPLSRWEALSCRSFSKELVAQVFLRASTSGSWKISGYS